MKRERVFKSTVLLVAFVLTASFGFAQTADSITISAKTISKASVPDPMIFIGNISGGKVSKETLLENPFLTAKDSKYDEIAWTILSYKVVFVVNGKEEAPIFVMGTQFSEQLKLRIQSAVSGTIVEFADIKTESIAGTRALQRVFSVRIQ